MSVQPAQEPSWLMPATVGVDPPGAMRFLLQPRWASGAHATTNEGLRRRDLPGFTELEVAIRFTEGTAVGVVYLLPNGDSSVVCATCFDAFFQPLRKLLYGPGDEGRRRQLWELFSRVRPRFMAANYNGLQWRFDDIAFVQRDDPSDGVVKNQIISEHRGIALGPVLDEGLVQRSLAVLGFGIELLEEAMTPIDAGSLDQRIELTDVLEVAGFAAKWLLKNAGDIGDVLELIDTLTDS